MPKDMFDMVVQLMIATILLLGVFYPFLEEQVQTVNATGISRTILNLTPLFVVLAVFMLIVMLIRR